MRRAAIVVTLVACGRFDFTKHSIDGGSGDAPVVVDAHTPCHPLGSGETIAQCEAALANPGSATDQLIHDCAYSCELGGCRIHDGCAACACNAYAWSASTCSAQTSQCGPPLSGTGCIGGGFYSGPPFNCPSTGDLVKEGACIVRVLIAMGDC